MEKRRVAIKVGNGGGETFFVGKIIDDTFFREFLFSSAVLWQNKEVSIDQRAFDFIRDTVKKIVFTDTAHDKSYEVGIRKFKKDMRIDDYGRGRQCYFKMASLKKLGKVVKTPYVAKTVTIGREGLEV